MPERIAVLFAKPVAPGISIATELRRAALRINQSLLRTNAKVPASDGCPLSRDVRKYLTVRTVAGMMTSTRAVDPVIKTPAQTVDSKLLIPLKKSGVQRPAGIGLAISVRIFVIKNLRSCCDNRSFAPRHDTRRKRNF